MNFKRHVAATTSAVLLIFASAAARAAPAVFGFEELTVPAHTAVPIPQGYAGATWTGWVLRRVDELNGSGLNSNDGSAVLAIGVTEAPEISFAQAVTFDGVLAINPFAKLAYEMYLGGEWVGSSGSRAAGGASLLPSNYDGALDRIVFHPGDLRGFSIDDVAIGPAAAVPEPGALALMLAGVAALGLARRRSRG